MCMGWKTPARPKPKLGLAWNQPQSSPAWPNSARGTSLSKNNDVTYDISITAVCCWYWASSVTEYRLLDSTVEELLILLFQPTVYSADNFSPSKLPLCTGDLEPHLTHGSLGPPESTPQTASQSVQNDQLTDHTTQSVTTGRTYIVEGCVLIISCPIL